MASQYQWPLSGVGRVGRLPDRVQRRYGSTVRRAGWTLPDSVSMNSLVYRRGLVAGGRSDVRTECRITASGRVGGSTESREVLAGMIVAPTVGEIVGVEADVEMTEGEE